MTPWHRNWLETVNFGHPSWIECNIKLSRSAWHEYGRDLESVLLKHPKTWPDYKEGDYKAIVERRWPPMENPEVEYVDAWGCVWRTSQYGYIGTVQHHPLGTDDALASFTPPAAETYNGGFDPVDFAEAADNLEKTAAEGRLTSGGLGHGYFLLRLEYLLGFENLMCNLMDPSDDFRRLVDTVHDLNRTAVRHWMDAGAKYIWLAEDLGAQDRSIIGPRAFREWALPRYKELHGMVQDAGRYTDFHTDGNIMDIADQILDIAPSVLNPQDQANGVENLRDAFKGKLCLRLDFDRQKTMPFGTPRDCADLVEYEIKTLGSERGGLMFNFEIRKDVSPDNVDAIASACERWSTWWFEK